MGERDPYLVSAPGSDAPTNAVVRIAHPDTGERFRGGGAVRPETLSQSVLPESGGRAGCRNAGFYQLLVRRVLLALQDDRHRRRQAHGQRLHGVQQQQQEDVQPVALQIRLGQDGPVVGPRDRGGGGPRTVFPAFRRGFHGAFVGRAVRSNHI